MDNASMNADAAGLPMQNAGSSQSLTEYQRRSKQSFLVSARTPISLLIQIDIDRI